MAGVAFYEDGSPHSVLSFTVDGERITRIDIVLAPAKLGGLSRSRSAGP